MLLEEGAGKICKYLKEHRRGGERVLGSWG